MCLLERIYTALQLWRTIFRSGRKIPFKKLSMKEIAKKSGTAELPTMPKTTVTLKSPVLKCSVAVPRTLTFWFVAFFDAGRLFTGIALRPFAPTTSSPMRFGPGTVSQI